MNLTAVWNTVKEAYSLRLGVPLFFAALFVAVIPFFAMDISEYRSLAELHRHARMTSMQSRASVCLARIAARYSANRASMSTAQARSCVVDALECVASLKKEAENNHVLVVGIEELEQAANDMNFTDAEQYALKDIAGPITRGFRAGTVQSYRVLAMTGIFTLADRVVMSVSNSEPLGDVNEGLDMLAARVALNSFTGAIDPLLPDDARAAARRTVSLPVYQTVQDSFILPSVFPNATEFAETPRLLEALLTVYSKVVDSVADSIHKHQTDHNSDAESAIALQSLALVVCLLAFAASVSLLVTERHMKSDHNAINKDFEVLEGAVKPASDALTTLDTICKRLGVMDTSIVVSDQPNQLELNLLRAKEPLKLLRPLVPGFVFCRQGPPSLSEGEHPPLTLDLTVGMKRSLANALLFVSFHEFNVEGVDTKPFSEYYCVLVKATEHFRGRVVQCSSDGLVAVFFRSQVGDSEEVEEAESLAAHAAFAISALAESQVAPLSQGKAVAPSMALVHAASLQGLLEGATTKLWGLVSSALLRAIEMEKLNAEHNSFLLTDQRTNDLLVQHGCFTTRPIDVLRDVGTIYDVMMEVPEESHPNYEEIAHWQELEKEKLAQWCDVWDAYESVINSVSMDALKKCAHEMKRYRACYAMECGEDHAFLKAESNVKKQLLDIGIAVDEDDEE